MGKKYDYEEIIEKIDGMTDPEGGIETQLNSYMFGSEVVQGILAVRQGHAMLKEMVDGDEVAKIHQSYLKEEMDDSLHKLKKNIKRLISDYARTLDRMQDCNCNDCKRNAAEFN